MIRACLRLFKPRCRIKLSSGSTTPLRLRVRLPARPAIAPRSDRHWDEVRRHANDTQQARPIARLVSTRELRLALLHHSKLAIHELIAIQRAFPQRLCRPVGDGEKEDTGECDDHREKSRVLIWIDGMRMSSWSEAVPRRVATARSAQLRSSCCHCNRPANRQVMHQRDDRKYARNRGGQRPSTMVIQAAGQR